MLELRLFGAPRVLRDGRPVFFDTRKAVALLALLGVTGTEHAREALAGMLWPDLDHTRARAALRRTLSVAAAPELLLAPTGVRLDADACRCDVQEFRRLAASDDPGNAARAVELAASGEFLAGFALRDSPLFDEWQLATAQQLRDELSQTLGRLVSRAIEDADMPAALQAARQRTRIDPLSEPAHADLIRVLARSGDRAAALTAYRALVRTLDEELGVPPLPSTVALEQAVRSGTFAQPAQAPPRPASARAAPQALAGRRAELDALEHAWSIALQRGRTAGLVGDPGIGKSALGRALVQRRRDEGAPALQVTGHAAERTLAFAVAAELVRALLPGEPQLRDRLGAAAVPLATLADDPAGPGAALRTPGDLDRLHRAFRRLLELRAEDRGLVVVVDDAHLLDSRSAALLGSVAHHPVRGVLLVVAWPTGSGHAPLPTTVLEVGEVLPVPPLDPDGVTELLGDRAGAEEALRRTRGVPLLLREYATGAGGPLATNARELVAARLEAAPDLPRQLVGAAAVIGTSADPDLLRAACGRDEGETVDAIEEAVARGLLIERPDGRGYDLPHDLVRDEALGRLSLARARLLHARVADVLVRRHAVDPASAPAGAIAGHLTAAGRDGEAAPWFVAAAARSTRLAAHDEALEQLRTALALGSPPLDTHEAMGNALIRLGRYREALVALDQAAAVAEGDPLRQAAIEHAIAGVHDRLGAWTLAHAHLGAALALLADGPAAEHARIRADLALVEHRLRRDSAAASAAAALDEAVAAGDDAASAQATNVLGVLAHARGAHAEACGLLARAVDLAGEDVDLRIAALNNLAHALLGTGDTAGALAAARDAVGLAEQRGDRHRLAALHSNLADLLHLLGREDEALTELTRSAAAFGGVQGSAARPEVWTLTEW